MKVWSWLQHPNITPLVGFHLNVGYDAAWLLSPWESLGSIASYLEAENPPLMERLCLVREQYTFSDVR